MGHAVRVMTERNPDATLLSIDGVGACDQCVPKRNDGETVGGFLDDMYIVSSLERTRHLYNLVSEKLWSVAGTQLHTRKTRCWNQNGRCLPNMFDLGPEVWSPQGVKVLGTPIGSFEFIKEVSDRRLAEEQRLWDAIPRIPDWQCAWQVPLQCAGPRCHIV